MGSTNDADRPKAVFRDARSRDVIRTVFQMHFGAANRVADLTWGKGAFWTGAEDAGWVVGLDLRPRYGAMVAADARHVPIRTGTVDVAIFDPPHQHGRSTTTTVGHQADYDRLPNQRDIHQLLADVAPELRRIARVGAIVKITDMVEAGRYVPTHIMFAAAAAPRLGWPCDLAILDSGVVRPMKPNQRVLHLRHAHSYFLIYKWAEREPRSPFWEVARG